MNKAKKEAKLVIRKYGTCNFSYGDLKKVSSDFGYTIVKFNNIENNEDVAALIDALGITDIARVSKGFTYSDNHYRLIFIHEALSEYEKRIVLSHEIGHIVCKHLDHSLVIGCDIIEEKEANDFSYYLLNPGFFQKVAVRLCSDKKKLVIIIVSAVLILTAAAAVSYGIYEKQFYGEYYVTATGSKYHLKSCRYLKGKTDIKRFTVKQKDSGNYSPCEVCLPNE